MATAESAMGRACADTDRTPSHNEHVHRPEYMWVADTGGGHDGMHSCASKHAITCTAQAAKLTPTLALQVNVKLAEAHLCYSVCEAGLLLINAQLLTKGGIHRRRAL